MYNRYIVTRLFLLSRSGIVRSLSENVPFESLVTTLLDFPNFLAAGFWNILFLEEEWMFLFFGF